MPTTLNSCNQTITQYNIQSGAALNTLNNIAPPATSGVPLISQGAASQPIFGTVLEAGGGTAQTTYATGDTLYASSANTLSKRTIGSNGSIYAVSGGVPTWASASSLTPSPAAVMSMVDDFIVCIITTSSVVSGQTWNALNINQTNSNPSLVPGHPGVLNNIVMTTGSAFVGVYVPGPSSCVLGGGVISCNWVFQITALSNVTNTYVLTLGLGDPDATVDSSNGTYFRYTNATNSGNWQIINAKSSVLTTTNTSTPLTIGWHNASVVANAAATSIEFFMDGVSLGIITTNIPTLGIGPFIKLTRTLGTIAVNTIAIDLVYMSQILTTSR